MRQIPKRYGRIPVISLSFISNVTSNLTTSTTSKRTSRANAVLALVRGLAWRITLLSPIRGGLNQSLGLALELHEFRLPAPSESPTRIRRRISLTKETMCRMANCDLDF